MSFYLLCFVINRVVKLLVLFMSRKLFVFRTLVSFVFNYEKCYFSYLRIVRILGSFYLVMIKGHFVIIVVLYLSCFYILFVVPYFNYVVWVSYLNIVQI